MFHYLKCMIYLGLDYIGNLKRGLIGFVDAGNLAYPQKARLQTIYIFIMGGTTILLRSQKQRLVTTSSNYAEIVAIHEACREYVWLRSMTQHIQGASRIVTSKEPPILYYEDNVACVSVVQIKLKKICKERHDEVYSSKIFFLYLRA